MIGKSCCVLLRFENGVFADADVCLHSLCFFFAGSVRNPAFLRLYRKCADYAVWPTYGVKQDRAF